VVVASLENWTVFADYYDETEVRRKEEDKRRRQRETAADARALSLATSRFTPITWAEEKCKYK